MSGERVFETGPGFVRAKECPDCGHTKCGESCVCNCDAARAEYEAATLRAQLRQVEAERDRVNDEWQSAMRLQGRDRRLRAAEASLQEAFEEIYALRRVLNDIEGAGIDWSLGVAENLAAVQNMAVAAINRPIPVRTTPPGEAVIPPPESCPACAKVRRHPGEGYVCAWHPPATQPSDDTGTWNRAIEAFSDIIKHTHCTGLSDDAKTSLLRCGAMLLKPEGTSPKEPT